jgi:sugar lactone lactonase YvrE
MVQLLLILTLLISPAFGKPKPKAVTLGVPAIEMDGGRMLLFDRTFSSEREVRAKRGFWNKLADIVAGEPEFHTFIRPYAVALDSHDRVIITDPGAFGIHIFDFAQGRYKFISHREGKEPLENPQCVAVDAQDNIYVTDSEAGKVFVFSPSGKLARVLGSLKGGEGFFKRPTGVAVDRASGEVYISDTWRHKIYVLDPKGTVLRTIGKNGKEPGEFNFPTDLRLDGDDLIVVDSMNFRIQGFTRAGALKYTIGEIFRPKGLALDSEGHIYVGDGTNHAVQVFDTQGHLLYYFGKGGRGPEEFQAPAGVAIDRNDRIYVVDSLNHRVQVLRYFGPGKFSARNEGAAK